MESRGMDRIASAERIERFPWLDRVFEKAEASLARKRIDMKDFEKNYGASRVAGDMNTVEELKKKFKESESPRQAEAKKLATIFEAILSEHAELSSWLGSNVTTMTTSEFDDFVNGVDMIAEFSENGSGYSYLGLGIDATFSSDLDYKLGKIKEEIESGDLSTIEYFHSADMGMKGSLYQVPRVVIGADSETLLNLIKLWDEEKKDELAMHPIQFQILEEMIAQLSAFEKYAEKMGEQVLSKRYRNAKNKIIKIYQERKQSVQDTGKRDKFHERLVNYNF